MKNKRTVKDHKAAAANDKDAAFNPAIPEKIGPTVAKVLDKIEKKKKRLPNVVDTGENRTVAVRYKFSEKEIADIAQLAAQRQIELVELEDEKKAVMSSFAERLKAKKIDIGINSRRVRDGWENRDHSCILVLDFKKKEKRYRDVTSKEIVKTEPFSPGDEQRRFV